MATTVANGDTHTNGVAEAPITATGVDASNDTKKPALNGAAAEKHDPEKPVNANGRYAGLSEHYPFSPLTLVERFIDEPRPLNVAVIGGGLAGVLAGILLPAKVPQIQLTIYDKNDDFVRSYPPGGQNEALTGI